MLHRLTRQWESPPTWLLLFLGLAYLQSRWVPLLPSVPAGRHLGAVFVIGGLAVIVMAAMQFRRHQTTILPREMPRAMLTTGLYAYSRNPIYVADALILAGCALRWDMAFLILVPVFMAVIAVRFIAGEEAGLRAVFGTAFETYAARVRRWV
jgi:protein-S-isoprenylcysteine O-methyltransferase Ste14